MYMNYKGSGNMLSVTLNVTLSVSSTNLTS